MEQITENQEMEKLMKEIDALNEVEKESAKRMHDAINRAYNYAKIEATVLAIDCRASGASIEHLDHVAKILRPFVLMDQITATAIQIDEILSDFIRERKG